MIAVTFDYGQTLAELDTEFLSRRLAERGMKVRTQELDSAAKGAWDAYNLAKRSGRVAEQAWSSFMLALLEGAGLPAAGTAGGEATTQAVAYLWSEQPSRNLWRRPIAGMRELLRDLQRSGARLAVLSNSEGRLAELLDELEWASYFAAIADSGRLGFEKPDRRIFEWTAEQLGVAPAELIHVGDAWAADIEGALAVGARAIWVTNHPRLPTGSSHEGRVVACETAEQIRTALRDWGVPA
jgi:putative hydrolase of the HAD superfamily